MAAFAQDTFTDTDSTALASHTPDVGGSWTIHPSYAGLTASIASNRVSGNANNATYYNAGTPPSADYFVTVGLVLDGTTFGQNYGPFARMNTGSLAWYSLLVNGNTVRIWKSDASMLASVAVTSSGVTDTWRLTIEVSGSSTTNIKGYVQRASDNQWLTSAGGWQVAQVAAINVNDSSSPVTAAGKSGLRVASEGPDLDNFEANNVFSPPGGGGEVSHVFIGALPPGIGPGGESSHVFVG